MRTLWGVFLDRLRGFPFVSVLLLAVMVGGTFVFGGRGFGAAAVDDELVQEAREILERSPQLEVDRRGHIVLGEAWLEDLQARSGGSNADSGLYEVSRRLRARSQSRLDQLIDMAYQARVATDPSFRLGVLGEDTPIENLWKHIAIHASAGALGLSILMLILAGFPLERVWGSITYGLFVALAIPVVAIVYQGTHASTGIPWVGGAGLSAAIAGAYMVRSFGGGFAVPGWLLLIAWGVAEVFGIRRFFLDETVVVPFACLASGVGIGAGVSLVIRLVGLENVMNSHRQAHAEEGRIPALEKAARLRTAGKQDEAFQILLEAWRANQKSRDLAISLWECGIDAGRVEGAAPAILPVIRDCLRRGAVAEAVSYWLDLIKDDAAFYAEATVRVRMAEALLDEGHAEQAIRTLAQLLDLGDLTPPLAQRVVRIARDLDPEITARAAQVALQDQGLDLAKREEYEALVPQVVARRISPPSEDERANAAEALERRVSAEHHPVEATRFPDTEGSGLDLSHTGELTDPDHFHRAEASRPASEPDASDIDPNALSLESLEQEFSGDLASLGLSDEPSPAAGSGGRVGEDPTAEWTAHGVVKGLEEAPDVGGAPDLVEREGMGGDLMDASHLDAGAFDASALQNPIDVPSETSEPLAPLGASDLSRPSLPDLQAASSTDAHSGPRPAKSRPLPPIGSAASSADAPAAKAPAPHPLDDITDEFDVPSDIDIEDAVAPRPLRVLEGVPLSLTDDTIEFEIEGRGKTKVALDKIEAVAVGAVSGISKKPVLVVDFALNWIAAPGEPLKVIRIRSDRFNPAQLRPDAGGPLLALKVILGEVLAVANATPLPSASAVATGSYERFADLATFERDVLFATR